MKVEVLRPNAPFIAGAGSVSRREALVILEPFKAIIDPADFWKLSKTSTILFTSPLGISISVNPTRTVTVTLNDNIKAVKVAVGSSWRDVVALPFPLGVGLKLKTTKKSLRVPTKYFLKNGQNVGAKYISVPLSRRIVPSKGGKLKLLVGYKRKRTSPKASQSQPIVIIRRKKKKKFSSPKEFSL